MHLLFIRKDKSQMENAIKGFKQVFETEELQFENGYIYFVRTNGTKTDGYIYLNGKKYGTGDGSNKMLNTLYQQTKSNFYYNNPEFIKIDYRGQSYYDTNQNKYVNSDSSDWKIQHMYVDEFLTTFNPSTPYQDPFKAIITLKMPLAYKSDGWCDQQLVMCQDFVIGDGQDDHGIMCPLWYTEGDMQWGGETLKNTVVKYTSQSTLPKIDTKENIAISYSNANLNKTFLTVFLYPLIIVKDTNGRIYSPILVSCMNENNTLINTRYSWLMSGITNYNLTTDLKNYIGNTNYDLNIKTFKEHHIKSLNNRLYGNNGNDFLSQSSSSQCLDTYNSVGSLQTLPSLIDYYFNNQLKILLRTIDDEGNIIDCANSFSTTRNSLYLQYRAYKEYIK